MFASFAGHDRGWAMPVIRCCTNQGIDGSVFQDLSKVANNLRFFASLLRQQFAHIRRPLLIHIAQVFHFDAIESCKIHGQRLTAAKSHHTQRHLLFFLLGAEHANLCCGRDEQTSSE